MNLGARLEGANKFFGTDTLLSARTVFWSNSRFLVRRIGNLIVMGKREAVMAHEPICLLENATPEQKKLVELTNAVVDTFVSGEFRACLAAIARLESEFGQRKLVEFYRTLCEQHIANPPQQFSGAIYLSEK